MEYTRHCTEIVTQTELLATELKAADLREPVPSCPGWSLGDLVRHIGGGHRWAEEMVRTRATEWLPDGQIRQVTGDDTGELPADWLVEGATRLAETLRASDPDAPIWAPFTYDRTAFWARRFAHETLVHRADATLAAGTAFAADPAVVVDAVDEWMELDAMPEHFEITPRKGELLGPGRTLAFAATDTGDAWFVDLTGDVIAWRRGSAAAAVTVRAPVTDLLLLIYRRRAATGPAIDVTGDRGLLEFWSGHVAFG
jgi:uncharacterized protein (TIGR03083 family)